VPAVKIYTKDFCGYCFLAKRLLGSKHIAFEEIDCSKDPATREWLVEKTGQRTVPQIFIGEVPIGGWDELSALNRAGALDPILAGTQAPTPVARASS
jgi:glutaredoxin 3